MTEKQNGVSGVWITKGALVLTLTLIPSGILLFVFKSLAWMEPPLASHIFVLSTLVFFSGAALLIVSKRVRAWLYSLGIGLGMAVCVIVLAGLRLLYLTPYPLVGNALFALAAVLGVGLFAVLTLRLSRAPSTTGLVTQSNSTLSSPGLSILSRVSEKVGAIELEHIPHDYLHKEDAMPDGGLVQRFHSIVRSLSSIPFAFRIQRVHGRTRVLFLTWSTDPDILRQQQTLLRDSIQNNLPRFRFLAPRTFEHVTLREGERGVVALVRGVPLSVLDENQLKDPLEAMTGVLQGMENGIYQVHSEPATVKRSRLRSLEKKYREELELSQTTVSRETRGLLSGPRQESKTRVNAEALRRAETLQRQITRLSGKTLCSVVVSCVAWGSDLAGADLDAQRLARTLVGALRPGCSENELTWEVKSRRSDVSRVLTGLPTGRGEVLTTDELTAYCILPSRDLGVRVSRRERFSSGTREGAAEETRPSAGDQETARIPKKRSKRIHLGTAIDESGKAILSASVALNIEHLTMHMAVFGNTRSGKTTSVLSILGQAIAKRVNPLILSPMKAYEMRVLPAVFPTVRFYTCGRSDIANLRLNIWQPPENVLLSKWVDRVVQVWTLYLPNDPVISMHLEDVIYTMYKNCNWDLKTNTPGRPILLQDFVDAVEEVGGRLEYGDEVRSNIYGALTARMSSILRKPALTEMLDVESGLTVKELLGHPTVVDLDALSENDKILVMGILTAAISEYKLASPTKDLTNLLVLEEAHYLLGRSDISGEANAGVRVQAVRAFIQMLRALGGTGLGVILVDQSPTILVPEAIKIPVNMVVHALSDDEDRRLVGRHSRCTEAQIGHIGGMQVGEAVVYLQHEGEPKNVKMVTLQQLLQTEREPPSLDDEYLRRHMLQIARGDQTTIPAESSSAEKESVQLSDRPVSMRERIERAVLNPEFEQAVIDCSKKRDPETLARLIESVAQEVGDGSRASFRAVLEYAGRYMNSETRRTFIESGRFLTGAESQ